MVPQVGRIVSSLDALGLKDNTVVIFLSDNGPVDGDLLTTQEWEQRNHIPLNGNKGEVFDNGIRVPLFIRWPGQFEPRTVDKALTSITDIFPTLMHLAGATSKGKRIDGTSLVPLLRQLDSNSSWSERTLYHTTAAPEWTKRNDNYWAPPNLGQDKSSLKFGEDGRWAVRSGRYKLVHYFGTEYLFDMDIDPYETQPVNFPIVKDRLRGLLHTWWTNMVNDPGSFSMPTFQIGWEGSSRSEVLAMGAVQTSQHISLHSHEADGWQNQGASAVYRVRIITPGVYRALADIYTFVNLEVFLTFYCMDDRYQTAGWIGENGFIGDIVINSAHDLCFLEVLTVNVEGNEVPVAVKSFIFSLIA